MINDDHQEKVASQRIRDNLCEHGLFAKFGVDSMSVDRFTQILYMILTEVENARDLVQFTHLALNPFDDGANETSFQITDSYFELYRSLYSAAQSLQVGLGKFVRAFYEWNELPPNRQQRIVESLNKINKLQVEGRAKLHNDEDNQLQEEVDEEKLQTVWVYPKQD